MVTVYKVKVVRKTPIDAWNYENENIVYMSKEAFIKDSENSAFSPYRTKIILDKKKMDTLNHNNIKEW